MPYVELVTADRIVIDPDVQLQFALNAKWWGAIAENFNHNYPPLTGVPIPDFMIPSVRRLVVDGLVRYLPDGELNGDAHDLISIIDGRHRSLGGYIAGVRSFRIDIHDEIDFRDVAAKAAFKLLADRDRRTVSKYEVFRTRLSEGDPIAVGIDRVAGEAGYRVGMGHGLVPRRLGCIGAVERYWKALGGDVGLARLLALNEPWADLADSVNGFWLGGLGLLVRDDYDLHLTAKQREKLPRISPAITVNYAHGQIAKSGGGIPGGAGWSGWSGLNYEVASYIRRRARMPRREPSMSGPTDSHSRGL